MAISKFDDGIGFLELRGLSTDTKPTDTFDGVSPVENGATFYCIDTGDLYMFNIDTKTWVLQ